MAIRLLKEWVPVENILGRLKGNLGVFQLASADRTVVFIGFAGGRSHFGLKGEVAAALELYEDVAFARFEVTTAYHTRYRELLMTHVADHGELPRFNEPIKLGRLSPA
jgi:hypothetical protein